MNTPSIVICDDNPIHGQCLEHLLKECPQWSKWPIIYVPSITELLTTFESLHPDSILLMDICFRDGNGIEAVANIQNCRPNIHVIYITGDISYCTDVYETNHCGFLVKPVSLTKLQQALQRTEKKFVPLQTVKFKIGHKIKVISLDDIIYLEKQLRKIVVITQNENCEFYGRFDELIPQLDQRMIRCHNSFIVNMDYVLQISPEGFQLKGGVNIPISRRRNAEVRNAFLHYLHGKNRYIE